MSERKTCADCINWRSLRSTMTYVGRCDVLDALLAENRICITQRLVTTRRTAPACKKFEAKP